MAAGRTTRRGAIVAAGALLAARRGGRAAPAMATVVGTATMPVLPCSQPECDVTLEPVSEVPLGSAVTLVDGAPSTERASGLFVRMRAGDTEGYAQDWYLREEGHNAPYLLQGAAGCGRLALIFNVGVGFEPDLGILDTLQREQIPATMFPMGWWVEERPAILDRMLTDGYPIGTHGYDAVELTGLDDDAVVADLAASVEAIEAAAGRSMSQLFTPYAAAIDDRVRALVAGAGFLPVAWTVAAADYGADATEHGVYDRVLDGVHDGALIELHLDGPASAVSTGRALPRLIERLGADGYRFVTVPEMLVPCAAASGQPRPATPLAAAAKGG